MFKEKDVEHNGDYGHDRHVSEKIGAPVYVDEHGAVAGESFTVGNSWYARTQRFVGKFGVEQRGIERVPEDERTDANLMKVGTLVRAIASPVPCADGTDAGRSAFAEPCLT